MSGLEGGEGRDRGAGAVLVVGLVAVVLVLAAGLGVLAQAAVARHRADAAADLAALAAADVLLGRRTGDACAWAGAVAARNGARLTACAPAPDGTVTVTAAVVPAGAAASFGPARATARAGPAIRPAP